MSFLEFFAEIVKAVAWPTTVIFLAYLYRAPLLKLLPRIQRFKHKDTEIEFGREVAELQKKSSPLLQAPRRSDEIRRFFELERAKITELIDIEPRSAIMKAFRLLESSAAQAVAKFFPDLDTKEIIGPTKFGHLLKNKEIFSEADFDFFMQIRKLRNKAAHMDDFQLSADVATRYCDIALSMAESLRNK